MTSKVYLSKTIEPILNLIPTNLPPNLAIKTHFGEKGCTTYPNPEIIKKVYNHLINQSHKPTLIETNVLYQGSRTNTTDHLQTAKEHGFDFAPIDILDNDNQFIEVPIDNSDKNAKLAKNLPNYNTIIFISHFTGHIIAGFGAAIKNISMGLASRGGKLDMHTTAILTVNPEQCTGCENCLNKCNFNAITMKNNKAEINTKTCIGCAACTAVCPTSAIRWQGSSSEELQKKIVQYAQAAKKIIPNMIFINILENITLECDCVNYPQKIFTKDIGILYSTDPVAIDKASLDLVNKQSQGGFHKIKQTNNSPQISYAEKMGLGTQNYTLTKLQ
ncbi:DUF362 domain-containing protein [archaeon]|jgi:uncharacterized protein|nr:DUF362 domain-containing protein [archaeon]